MAFISLPPGGQFLASDLIAVGPIFGMATLPFLCRDPFFTKISQHKNVSFAVVCQFTIFVLVKINVTVLI